MYKYVTQAVSIVLGLCFLAASILILFNLVTPPPLPEGTAAWHFNEAFFPTGYVKFVKMFELVGALVVMFPRTRNFGLLLLGPVIVNIIAFHAIVENDPKHLLNPMIIVIIVCALFLFWDGRKKFSGLLN